MAAWTAFAAPTLPMFVYITPFKDMLDRARCWASFYADPAWHEARARTNAGAELVEEYEIQFLRGLTDWREAPDGSLDELVIHRTLIGKSGPSLEALAAEHEALERAGAFVQGQFDMLSGGTLPSAITCLRWPDWDARAAAQDRLDADPVRSERIGTEISHHGRLLLGHSASFLLDPVAVDWAG